MSARAKPSQPSSGAAAFSAVHWRGIVVTFAVILAGGLTQRGFSAWVQSELDAPIRLDPPLRSLAYEINGWIGVDVPMRESLLRIAGNDDYVNRAYSNAVTGQQANLYVGYTARPRTMLGHRPSVCYPSAGWSPTEAVERRLDLPGGAELPARVQAFFKPGLHNARVLVLNFYVLAGEPTIDEDSFWSIGWRTPNLARDSSRYVAQVQVIVPVGAGGDEAAERLAEQFAIDVAPRVLALLPKTFKEEG